MNDSILSALSYSLVSNGISTLKFNFRGVGNSTGSFGNGAGETLDALAALKFTSELSWVDKEKISILGYSFGAKVALNASLKTSMIKSLVLIAPAIKKISPNKLKSLNISKLLIYGEEDGLIQASDIKELFQNMVDPKQLSVIPNANHFFENNLDQVIKLVTDFFQ
jgi:alpha/beta superfamily hydrolase